MGDHELALDIPAPAAAAAAPAPAAPAAPPPLQRPILVYWRDCEDARFRGCSVLFGPNCGGRMVEPIRWTNSKRPALIHVLDSSGSELSRFLGELGTIENPARAAYSGDVLARFEDSHDFLTLMAEDGCFFLLIVFFILGRGCDSLLNFPWQHPIFGMGRLTEHTDVWLHSMFLVGNQIPFVVLEKLKQLSFFQQVIAKIREGLPLPPSTLADEVLYKFLMVEHTTKPVDLIDFFWSTVLGSNDAAIPPTPQSDSDDAGNWMQSARQLNKEQRIEFRRLERGVGIRGSHFEHGAFRSVLYLPAFDFGSYAYLLIRCLRNYELVHQKEIPVPEVSYYFKFLGDLIPTEQDAMYLASIGIIRGRPIKSLPDLLHSDENHPASSSALLRREIRAPWWPMTFMTTCTVLFWCLTLILAYLPAHYSILTYYRRR